MKSELIEVNQAEAELVRIETAAERIFEMSPLLGDISKLIGDTRRDIADAVGHRNVSATILSVIGSKNSGKSWLCRTLVSQAESRESIRTGTEIKNTTEKITWIGSDAPEQMHEEFETRIKVPGDGMVDLGRPYILLDVPGYNDSPADVRAAARKCLALAPLRVFITIWQNMPDEEGFHYLSESDGTRILPLIVDRKYPRKGADYERNLSDFLRRMKKHCPHAEICPPVVIPSVDHADDTAKADELAKDIVRKSLRGFMDGGDQVSPRVVSARMEIFKLRLHGILGSFFERVKPHYSKLNQAEDAALSKIIDQLLGSENTLKAGVRMRLLMETVRTLPVGFFPYRMLLTTMTLAAGAIDRLILAFSGNIPSLAITAFQTSRNIKRLQEMRANAGQALRERAGQMAREELAEVNDIFLRAIEQEIDLGERSKIRAAAREIHLSGIGRIESRSGEIFEQSLSCHAPGAWLPWTLGGLATLCFFGLAAAPAWAVYNEFFQAWRASFHDSSPAIWQDFPAPSGSMIFATLLLMTLPVVFFSLLTVVLAVTPARVKRCVEAIVIAHNKMRNELLQSRAIRITTKDPVREAVRTLLDACPTCHDQTHGEPPDKLQRDISDTVVTSSTYGE
jgi:hypothetical protein